MVVIQTAHGDALPVAAQFSSRIAELAAVRKLPLYLWLLLEPSMKMRAIHRAFIGSSGNLSKLAVVPRPVAPLTFFRLATLFVDTCDLDRHIA